MNKIFMKAFKNFFFNKTSLSVYNTKGNSLAVPQVKTATFGPNSFILHAIRAWNFFQNKGNITTSLSDLTHTKFLKIIEICIPENAYIS